MELNLSQDVTDAMAAENRESYRNSLRANKKKIAQAQESRPSLILRHDQVWRAVGWGGQKRRGGKG